MALGTGPGPPFSLPQEWVFSWESLWGRGPGFRLSRLVCSWASPPHPTPSPGSQPLLRLHCWRTEGDLHEHSGLAMGSLHLFLFHFLKSFFGKGSELGAFGQRAGMWNVNTNFRLIGTEADMDADHPQGPRNSLLPCPPPPPCCSLTSGKLAISSRVSHTALCRAFLFFHPLKGELG